MSEIESAAYEPSEPQVLKLATDAIVASTRAATAIKPDARARARIRVIELNIQLLNLVFQSTTARQQRAKRTITDLQQQLAEVRRGMRL